MTRLGGNRSDKSGQPRTDWAEQGTALASKRTLAAWGRTALSCIDVGLIATKLSGDLEPYQLRRVLTVGLMGLDVLLWPSAFAAATSRPAF